MRFGFREKPWDLLAASLYTTLVALSILALQSGIIVAVLLTLVVPGYVIIAALFPKGEDLSWIERIALSIVLSILVGPAVGALLSYTPLGLGVASLTLTLTALVLGVAMIAYARRMALPAKERLTCDLTVGWADWEKYSRLDKMLTIALTIGLVAATGAILFLISTPPPETRYTEFYLSAAGGPNSSIPSRLLVSQTSAVLVTIANREGGAVNYSIRVDLVGVAVVHNSTGGFNTTVEVNRTTWSWMNLSLAIGENWTFHYGFSISYVGPWKIEFSLFKNGDIDVVYRRAHFYVLVA